MGSSVPHDATARVYQQGYDMYTHNRSRVCTHLDRNDDRATALMSMIPSGQKQQGGELCLMYGALLVGYGNRDLTFLKGRRYEHCVMAPGFPAAMARKKGGKLAKRYAHAQVKRKPNPNSTNYETVSADMYMTAEERRTDRYMGARGG